VGPKKGFIRDLAHTKKEMSGKTDIHESKEKDSSTQSFQQSYYTISCEVIKATSINGKIKY